jgi:SHS2 domain-containing protein
MAAVKSFEFMDHTGDLGVIAYGETCADLFCHAAEAFFEIITEPENIRGHDSRNISLEARGLEDLLVTWLNEFLYLFDTKSLLYRRFEIHRIDDHQLEATAWGEAYHANRHPIKTLIKAVTFHQLRIWEEEGIWRAQIVFDL